MNELSPELKKLLQTARKAYSPDEARVAAVRESIAARVTAQAAGGSAAQAAPSSSAGAAISSGAAWAKPIAMLVIAALGAGGLWLGVRRDAPAPVDAPARVHHAPPAVQPAPVAVPAAAPRPDEPVAAARETARANVARGAAPAKVARAAEVVRTADVARAAGRAVTPVEQPAAPRALGHRTKSRASSGPDVSAAQDRSRVAPAREAPAETQAADAALEDGARAAPDPGTQEPPAPVADDALVDELGLLRRARAALARERPAEALALAQQHASRYPRGTLRQERLATQVLALCGLQRTEEARVLARELERVAPRSPHLMRLRASCVTQGGIGEAE